MHATNTSIKRPPMTGTAGLIIAGGSIDDAGENSSLKKACRRSEVQGRDERRRAREGERQNKRGRREDCVVVK